jgi:hypothetical protein
MAAGRGATALGHSRFRNSPGCSPTRAIRSRPPPSPVKPPERCPYCGSPKIATKGRRLKKLETVRLYHCRACDRGFTPGPRSFAIRRAMLFNFVDGTGGYGLES